MPGGCRTHREASKHMWVSKQKEGPLHPPITCRYPKNIQMHMGALGKYGVFEHMGASGGVQTHRGCPNVWGCPDAPPSVKHTCH